MFDKSEETNSGGSQESRVSFVNQGASTSSTAVIGSTICIKGEISGDESLTINGKVEGSIELREHDLVVGQSGAIQANMVANEVRIDGEVKGDITGVEKVIVSNSGRVHGNIVAPRVTLEDGAKFKGSIDMDPSERGASDSLAPTEANKTDAAKKLLQQVKREVAAAKTAPQNA